MRQVCLSIVAYFLAGILLSACDQMPCENRLTIAVATNFQPTLQLIEPVFEAQFDVDLVIVSGSTGKLYAQIRQGAPYDVFLSADQWRPQKLIEDGLGVGGTEFTYAYGRLVLWGPNFASVGEDNILDSSIKHIAIANPDLAPYGRAAQQALDALSLWDGLEDKLVLGQNVGQVIAYLQTENAQLGFVSLALIPKNTRETDNVWLIPDAIYDPIAQDAILLKRAEDDMAAKAFLEFLQSETAQDIIKDSGYYLQRPAL